MEKTSLLGRLNLKAIILLVTGGVLLLGLSVPFYLNLKRNGLRAEAKIMLGYVATLQSAHYTDAGRYASFEEFYGAQINGKENCSRPEGAVELGFSLKGCDRDPDAGGLRYAYRVKGEVNPETQQPDLQYGYRAEAISGSDVTSEDYICASTTQKDVWSVSSNKEPQHEKDCE